MNTRVAEPPKTADPVYSTPEYEAWRDLVVRRAGGRCQVPGCDYTGRRVYADHVVELKDGGSPFDPANGQCLCPAHHQRKTVAERSRRMARRY